MSVEIEEEPTINALGIRSTSNWMLNYLLTKANYLIKYYENIIINHIHGEGNVMEDEIENLGVELNYLIWVYSI